MAYVRATNLQTLIFMLATADTAMGSGFRPSFYRPQRSWGKVIFSVACVKNSVHMGGGGLPHCMLGHIPPRSRPPGSRPPPGADTAPGAVQVGRYGNKGAVRILLECILVTTYFYRIQETKPPLPPSPDPLLHLLVADECVVVQFIRIRHSIHRILELHAEVKIQLELYLSPRH